MKNPIMFACLVFILFATGCDKPGAADGDSAVKDGSSACTEQGGDWRQVCPARVYQCVKPYPDAGKACNDSSECEGECLFELVTLCDEGGECKEPEVPEPGSRVTGTCQRDDDPCGSFVLVQDGLAQPIIHRD